MRLPRPATRLAPLLALLLWAGALRAQPQLFPDLCGGALRAAIAETYAPVAVLSLAESKDTLYAVIDRDTLGGTPGVTGLYTGFFAPFDCDPDCDPSQDVYNNGSGISQEHTWPRSMGAETGLAESDLHHLFPAKQSVNAARGNLPFGESDDAATTAWYAEDQAQSSAPPVETRDLWSERQGSALFEPREAVKGDVARALFYFYAMYGPGGTGQADTSFWAGMRETLLIWHRQDPATAAEVARSERVAHYQATGSGAPAINPFVADSSLAERAYAPRAVPSGTESGAEAPVASLTLVGPNPVRGTTTLTLAVPSAAEARVEAFDLLGRRVAVLYDGPVTAGTHRVPFEASGLPPGVYVVRATAGAWNTAVRLTSL